MAGHSKWSNIKHRKAAQDTKRGKVFTKLIRELVIAAKSGNNASDNPRLRAAIDKALNANMARDTIDRAIKRGAGADDANHMEEIVYEGYAPGGIAILVECLSDNRNRTISEVRHAFTKFGGNLGTDGSVAYLFKRQGILIFDYNPDKENALIEAVLEAGADDININGEVVEILTDWKELINIKETLHTVGFHSLEAEVAMLPTTKISLEKNEAEKLMRMVDHLEDLDDVQNVYTNAEMADAFLFSVFQ